MAKIAMTTPLVEMDGDEMTRILWRWIKDELLLPFVDLKTEYYDLGLEYRNETNDQVTVDSAEATKKYGVAVKCATITPNAARGAVFKAKIAPTATIRARPENTIFAHTTSYSLLVKFPHNVFIWAVSNPVCCLQLHKPGAVFEVFTFEHAHNFTFVI